VRQLVVTVSERGREFLPRGAGDHAATFRVDTAKTPAGKNFKTLKAYVKTLKP
jgi:hypothetical protein